MVTTGERSELVCVYDDLFSGEPERQHHAISRVTAWKARNISHVPTAIQVSAEMVGVFLLDEEWKNSVSHASTFSRAMYLRQSEDQLRLNYSMALVRFVNLLTEKFQGKFHARTVHDVASEIGVPDWLVDVRHNATHSALPSLAVLRAAAEYSLCYIRGNYWESQLSVEAEDVIQEVLDDIEETEVVEENTVDTSATSLDSLLLGQIFTQVSRFIRLQIQIHTSEASERKRQEWMTEVDTIIKSMESGKSTRKLKQVALSVVLQVEGHLLLTDQQLHQMKIDSKDLMNASSGKVGISLPYTLTQLWHPLLRLLGFARPLLLARLCADLVADAESLRSRLQAGWIYYVFRQCADAEFFRLDVVPLIHQIASQPNRWTGLLLEGLFSTGKSGLDSVQQKQLLASVRAYHHQVPSQMSRTSFKSLVENWPDNGAPAVPQQTDLSPQSLDNSGPWKLSSANIDWSRYLVGSCPDFNLTYTNLELTTRAQSSNDHFEEDFMDDKDNGVVSEINKHNNLEGNTDYETEQKGSFGDKDTSVVNINHVPAMTSLFSKRLIVNLAAKVDIF